MADAKPRIEVGRVIFGSTWRVQTLRNHVGNVVKLTQEWNNPLAFQGVPFDLTQTQKRVIRAAEIHDMAKPAHFRLNYGEDRFKANQWHWSYSFAGHRFNAFDDDPYVQTLAQLHHEYSVAGLTQNMARLKLDENTKPFAENLPLDLYALEMCDQVEATVARARLSDEAPESRVFMDFQFYTDRAKPGEYQLEPFVYGNGQFPVTLMIEYADLIPPSEMMKTVEAARQDKDKRRSIIREIERWLLETLQKTSLKYYEVTLCPWI